MALDAVGFDEVDHIPIAPVEDRKVNIDVFTLRVVTADNRFVLGIVLGTLDALASTNPLHSIVEYLILLEYLATKPRSPCREAFASDNIKEPLVWHRHLHAIILAMLHSAWWVDGRVLVDGSVRYASHLREREDNVAILATAITHLYRVITTIHTQYLDGSALFIC